MTRRKGVSWDCRSTRVSSVHCARTPPPKEAASNAERSFSSSDSHSGHSTFSNSKAAGATEQQGHESGAGDADSAEPLQRAPHVASTHQVWCTAPECVSACSHLTRRQQHSAPGKALASACKAPPPTHAAHTLRECISDAPAAPCDLPHIARRPSWCQQPDDEERSSLERTPRRRPKHCTAPSQGRGRHYDFF